MSSHPGDNLMIHAAVEVCQPGDILVVTNTAPSTHGMFGDLLATSLMARGVRGLVIDAGVRDTSDLRSMGFPVWSRYVSCQGTVKATPGSVNVPVVIGGVTIHPGDVICADDDGVVAVGRDEAGWALEQSLARLDKEAGTPRPVRVGRARSRHVRVAGQARRTRRRVHRLERRHGPLRDQDAAPSRHVGAVPRRVARRRRDRRVRVGVELGPLLPARRAVRRTQPRGLDDARRARPGDLAPPARRDGQRHAPPPPGGDGQHGCHDRPHLGWSFRARHGRRMERDGIRRIRHPARLVAGALRPVRGGDRGDRVAAQEHGHQLLRPVVPDRERLVRTKAGAGLTSRSWSAARVAGARCAPRRGSPTNGT